MWTKYNIQACNAACIDKRSLYVYPTQLAKNTTGGGVALRATFAALIALGSIPGAAAITPNLAHVAFADPSSANGNFTGDVQPKFNLLCSDEKKGTDFGDFGQVNPNLNNYFSAVFKDFTTQLQNNGTRIEISVEDLYKAVEEANNSSEKFYEYIRLSLIHI